MTGLLFISISIFLYKLMLNFTRLKQIQHYEKEFSAFLCDKPSKIDEHKLQTIDLFKKAGIKDTYMPVSQPIGFGKVANFNISIFDNFPMSKRTVAEPALLMFKNAIGVYKSRMLESINPLYWIELIVFFPKNILRYIGLDLESSASKLWNVFLTFIWWILCTVVTIFLPEIKDSIIKFLAQF